MCKPLKRITYIWGYFFAFLFLLYPIPSFGEALVENNITEDTILESGTYLASKVTVESGVTLTIKPGVTIKFEESGELNVYGKLIVEGLVGSDVVMEPDDNNPLGWQGIKFFPKITSFQNSDSILENTTIISAVKGVECIGASPKIISCLIKDSTSYAIYLHNSLAKISFNRFVNNEIDIFCDETSSPIISLNTFGSSTYLAEVAPNIVENIVKGNQGFYINEDSSARTVIKILGGSITKASSWPTFLPSTANTYKFTYYISDDLYIAEDASLKLYKGGSVEIARGKSINVAGTLSAIGTEEKKIIFTAAEKEEIINWGEIHFLPTSKESELVFCEILYGGSKEAAIIVESSSTVIKNSNIGYSSYIGFYVNSTSENMNIENNVIFNSGSFPIAARESGLNSIISHNTFKDNNFNKSVVVLPSLISSTTTWDKIGYTRVLLGITTISEDAILKIKKGVILKFLNDGGLSVDGKLEADGTEEQIIFTSAQDTKHGYKAGLEATSPKIGDWLGISFNSKNSSILKNCLLTYGSGIWVGNSDVTISQCTISHNENSGIACASTSTPFISGNEIAYNNGYNIEVPLHLYESVFIENSFNDNAVNALYISGGTSNSDVIWERDTYNGKSFFYVIGGDIDIGGKLSIEKNVLLKLVNSSIKCTGKVSIIGDADSPVTLTSAKDAPSKNDWGGIIMAGENSKNIVKHCNIEYGNVALLCSGADVTLENVSLVNNSTAIEAINGARVLLAGVNICTNKIGIYLRDSYSFIFNSLFRNNIDSVYAYNSLVHMRNTVVSENNFGIKLDSPLETQSISYSDIYGNEKGNLIVDGANTSINQYGYGNISKNPKFKSDSCYVTWDDESPFYSAGELGTNIGYKAPMLDISTSYEFSAYDQDVTITIKTDKNDSQSNYISYVIMPDNSVYAVEMSNAKTGITGTFHIEEWYPKGRYTIIGIAKEGTDIGVDTSVLYVNTDDWEGIPPIASFAKKETSTPGQFSLDASTSSNANGTYESLTYNWSLGDGVYKEGKILLYKYKTDGEYKVELTVTDKFGESTTSTQIITVSLPPPKYYPNIEKIDRTDPERIDGRLISLVRVVIFDENKDVKSVTIDLSSWGIPSIIMRDDGKDADITANDSIYYAFIEVPSNIEPGKYSISITVLDEADLNDTGYVKYDIDSNLLGSSSGNGGNNKPNNTPTLSTLGGVLLFGALSLIGWLKSGDKAS